MLFSSSFAIVHIVAVIVSTLLLISAWKAPRLGRALYCGLFSVAACVNLAVALAAPATYLAYCSLAVLDGLGPFICGPLSTYIRPIVVLIAIGHATIAAGLLLGGRGARFAVAGSFVFLVGVTPLGAGAAFPATLVLAVGALLLLRGAVLDGPLGAASARALGRAAR